MAHLLPLEVSVPRGIGDRRRYVTSWKPTVRSLAAVSTASTRPRRLNSLEWIYCRVLVSASQTLFDNDGDLRMKLRYGTCLRSSVSQTTEYAGDHPHQRMAIATM